MALITCTECGKQFSDKAPACPECGCPISEMEFVENPATAEENSQNPAPIDLIKNGVSSLLAPGADIQKVSVVQVDKTNRKFRIKGSIDKNGKKTSLIGGATKGILAVSTMGMSVAAEKALGLGKKKVGSKEWHDFDDLISYELLEDDAIVTSGGVGQALIGGAIFGGVGAIAGGITGKRIAKKRVDSITIKVTLNDFSSPCILIPLITKPVKTNSKEYQNAFKNAHEILSILDVITHNK